MSSHQRSLETITRHQRMRFVKSEVTQSKRRVEFLSLFVMIVCTTILCVVAVGTLHVWTIKNTLQNMTEPINKIADCKASTEVESRDFLEHYLTLDLIFATLFLFSLLLLTGIDKKFAHLIFVCLMLYIVFVSYYFFHLAGNKDIMITKPILTVKLIVLLNVVVIMLIFYFRQIKPKEPRSLPLFPVRERIAVAVINSSRNSRRVPPSDLIRYEMQHLQTSC